MEETAAVGFDEPLQIGLALQIVGIAEQPLDLHAARHRVVVDDIAQDPDESQIDRVLEGGLDGRPGVILPSCEIAEALVAAAGKEGTRRSRIGSLHRRVEHRLQSCGPAFGRDSPLPIR